MAVHAHALRKLLVLAIGFAVTVPALPVAAATGSVSGTAFHDVNRNGVYDLGESPYPDHTIYVIDSATNQVVGASTTDSSGAYSVSNLAAGDYRLQLASSNWYAIREAWVPTTTGSVFPWRTINLDGPSSHVDFGWREIARSTDASAPISALTAPNGMRVESFNDALTAQDIYEAVMSGTLVGEEASSVTVRFDLTNSNVTGMSVNGTPGSFSGYRATVNVTYLSWLDYQDATLSHEYGHAWSMFYDYLYQQDGYLTSYLEARNLAGDSRLDTSHAWSRKELIAEDYRQLFGSPSARLRPQENPEIPLAKDVPGLEGFLRDTFRTAPASSEPTQPADTTAPTAEVVTPSESATVSGAFTVEVDANDVETTTLAVTVQLGSTAPVGTSYSATTGMYTATVDASQLADGTYLLTASAEDQAGNVGTDTVSLTVTTTTPKKGGSTKGGGGGGSCNPKKGC